MYSMRKTVRHAIWGPGEMLIGRLTMYGKKQHTEVFYLNGYAFVQSNVFNCHVLLVGNELAIAVFRDAKTIDRSS